jgi:hypothetical protein
LVSTGNQLLAAGEFGCSGAMVYGNNLMSVQKQTYDTTTYTVLNPLTLTDNAVNDIALAGTTLYFGGSFITNGFTDTLNRIGEMQFQSTGIKRTEQERVSLTVFPNPASAQISIQSSGNKTIEQLEIFDVSGRRVFVEKVNEPVKTISVAAWPLGVYTIKASIGGTTGVTKLVKE